MRKMVALLLLLPLWGCQPPGYVLELEKGSRPPLVHIYNEGSFPAGGKSWSSKSPCVERIRILPELREENDPIYWSLTAKSGCVPLRQLVLGQTPDGFVVERAYDVRPGKRYYLEMEGTEHRDGSILIEL